MRHLGLNTGTVGVGHNTGTSEITVLENKWEGNTREITERIDGMAAFAGGIWFRSHTECMEFAEKNILEGKLQWFIYIIS